MNFLAKIVQVHAILEISSKPDPDKLTVTFVYACVFSIYR